MSASESRRSCKAFIRRSKSSLLAASALAAAVVGVGGSAHAATTYAYSRTASNTSPGDSWSAGAGANWNALPVSGTDSVLTFSGTLAAATTIYNTNDLGNFTLNKINFTNAGPASGTVPTQNISGNPLVFAIDGANVPTINFATTGTIKPVVNISNDIRLIDNLTLTGNTGTNPSNNATKLTLSGVISDNTVGVPRGLTSTGTSFYNLTNTNTYTGGTTVSGGILMVSASGALSSGDVSVTTTDGAVVVSTGTNIANNFSITGDGPSYRPGTVIIPSPGAIILAADATVSGTITLTGNSRISTYGGSGTAYVTGKITGGYAMDFGHAGNHASPKLQISNSGNDYAGDTTLFSGTTASSTGAYTVMFGNNEVIPHGAGKGNLVFNAQNTLTLDLNGKSETVNGLVSAGSGAVTNRVIGNTSAAAASLTIGGNDATSTFSGLINNGTGGVALTKIGSGTITLQGTHGYQGDTTISGGRLIVDTNYIANAIGPVAANQINATSDLVLSGGAFEIIGRIDGSALSESVTTSASTTVTVSSTAGLVPGQAVTGTFIGSGKYIRYIASPTTFVLSSAATAGTDSVTIAATDFSTSQTFASLTLGASSTIDFGAGNQTVVRFNAVTQSVDGSVLTIDNWTGVAGTPNGTERLLFQLAAVTDFTSQFSQSEVAFTGFGTGYTIDDVGGGLYEITPAVPEPASMGLIGLAAMGFVARRRRP